MPVLDHDEVILHRKKVLGDIVMKNSISILSSVTVMYQCFEKLMKIVFVNYSCFTGSGLGVIENQ